MLKSILVVWVLAQNLSTTQQAYQDFLGYERVDEGVMSAELSAAIARPELTGNAFVTLMPPTGPQVGIRIVAGASPAIGPCAEWVGAR